MFSFRFQAPGKYNRLGRAKVKHLSLVHPPVARPGAESGKRGLPIKSVTAFKEMWRWAERKPPKLSTAGSNQGSFTSGMKKNQGNKLFGRDILGM